MYGPCFTPNGETLFFSVQHPATDGVEADTLERWCALLVRGLSYYHWKTVIGSDCFFDFMVLTKDGEAGFGSSSLWHRADIAGPRTSRGRG
jgi:secreted PhoX family phosphatase